MKDKTISFTIPLDASVLLHTAKMLSALAAEYAASDMVGAFTEDEVHEDKEVTQADAEALDASAPKEPNPAEIFGAGKSAEPVQSAAADTVTEPDTAPPDAPVVAPATNSGVEVDKDGLPWDERIHASTKTKLKSGEWKKKRGVDDALVTEVEAELRAVLAIPAAPVSDTPPPPPATEPAQEQEPPPPPATEAPIEAITTFPQLLTAITEKGIDQPTVTAAVTSVGLPSLPLAATRPDLIPQIAAALNL